MTKKHSLKFWLSFWTISALLLFGWYIFLEYKNNNYFGLVSLVKPTVKILPISKVHKAELFGVMDIVETLSQKSESTFLLLFQNNNELRPGGGYIGSFGIMKIKNGKIAFVDSHDTNVFDSGGSSGIAPPKPMQDMLGIKDWELRDSNWSPDFAINAQRAEYFYHLEGGQEKIDGVIALSTELLPSFLEIIGPIEIDGYPGVYNNKNVIEQLEYQVEKGYYDQGIEKGKRKYIMKKMFKTIANKIQQLDWSQKKQLLSKIEQHLNRKDVMLYFTDKDLQQKIKKLGWSGEVKQNVPGDYLMMVDANLGARKSDAVMKRQFEYTVDFRRKKPVAKLKITYTHQGTVRDLLTDDYRTYLRVFVPRKSWLYDTNGLEGMELVDFGKELGKKTFGILYQVQLGKTKTIEFDYYLPKEITFDNYQLLIQKQPGIDRLQGKVKIIDKMGNVKQYTVDVDRDVRVIFGSKKKQKQEKKAFQKNKTVSVATFVDVENF